MLCPLSRAFCVVGSVSTDGYGTSVPDMWVGFSPSCGMRSILMRWLHPSAGSCLDWVLFLRIVVVLQGKSASIASLGGATGYLGGKNLQSPPPSPDEAVSAPQGRALSSNFM